MTNITAVSEADFMSQKAESVITVTLSSDFHLLKTIFRYFISAYVRKSV